MNVYEKSVSLHKKYRGKMEMAPKFECNNYSDLSLAYSPGVAMPCQLIKQEENASYELTNRGNTIAVISDGSAVLGLGNIGAYAALPVMEGKSLLFKKFANIDAFPLCINTQDTEEIIKFCKLLEPCLRGINLEDISAPRCVEIERRLCEEMNIPVFHDDQHGTAIVVLAALINVSRLLKKDPKDFKIIVSGTGAAGSSIIKHLYNYGFTFINAFDINGCLVQEDYDSYDFLKKELLEYVNPQQHRFNNIGEALVGADVFIGVSVPGIVTKDMIKTMNEHSCIFALANPEPEIKYEDAIDAGAYIVGTGRSDFPNQINNILAFPGLFKGALTARAKKITNSEKIAASEALAYLITADELSPDYIIPSAFDERVVDAVSNAVEASCHQRIEQIDNPDF